MTENLPTIREELKALYLGMADEDYFTVEKYLDHLYDPGFMVNRQEPMLQPDFVIAPDGEPYLYRWYLFGNPHFHPEMKERPGINLHIQVASDPERPLHDHPWDNVSHIIAGGYEEIVDPLPHNQRDDGTKWLYGDDKGQSISQFKAIRKKGDVIYRTQKTAHRLILPKGVQYTITIFTYGPKIHEWGFWYPDGWHSNRDHVAIRDGVSVHVNKGASND